MRKCRNESVNLEIQKFKRERELTEKGIEKVSGVWRRCTVLWIQTRTIEEEEETI